MSGKRSYSDYRSDRDRDRDRDRRDSGDGKWDSSLYASPSLLVYFPLFSSEFLFSSSFRLGRDERRGRYDDDRRNNDHRGGGYGGGGTPKK
jgi:hypothetical protein